MPVHPLTRNYAETLREDREAFILADKLGYSEGYCGEHLTDLAENIPSSLTFIGSARRLHIANQARHGGRQSAVQPSAAARDAGRAASIICWKAA